jgi:hypothetical protein
MKVAEGKQKMYSGLGIVDKIGKEDYKDPHVYYQKPIQGSICPMAGYIAYKKRKSNG